MCQLKLTYRDICCYKLQIPRSVHRSFLDEPRLQELMNSRRDSPLSLFHRRLPYGKSGLARRLHCSTAHIALSYVSPVNCGGLYCLDTYLLLCPSVSPRLHVATSPNFSQYALLLSSFVLDIFLAILLSYYMASILFYCLIMPQEIIKNYLQSFFS